MKSNDTFSLIESDEIREQLKGKLQKARSVILVSAYIKEIVIDWITENIKPDSQIQLIGRFRPDDFLSEASDISACAKGIALGWRMYMHENNHAKLYMFDESEIVIGSANLTTSGLKLYGSGNFELATVRPAGENDKSIIQSLISDSFPMDKNILDEMESILNEIRNEPDRREKAQLKWMEIFYKRDIENLWVHDLPFTKPTIHQNTEEATHDKEVFSLTGNKDEDSLRFKRSKIYQWLIKTITEKNGTKDIYFGELTAQIHNSLQDDPRPYRKKLKQLLQNLTEYIGYYDTNLRVDRPNHSQRIFLKTSLEENGESG